MHYLYHQFVQQTKQAQIQAYNRKHQDYLIRSKQLNPHQQPQPPQKSQRKKRQFAQNNKPKPQKIVQSHVPSFQIEEQENSFHHQNKVSINEVTFGNRRERPIEKKVQYEYKPIEEKKYQLTPQKIDERPLAATKNDKQIEEYAEIELVPCPLNCGRSFKPETLDKHAKVCKKVFQEKRKPFEVKKAPQEAQKVKNKAGSNEQGEKKESKWKKQSEKFRKMLKMGKGELTKQEMEEMDDRIKCQYCGRKFNQTAAKRHIQVCKKKSMIKK